MKTAKKSYKRVSVEEIAEMKKMRAGTKCTTAKRAIAKPVEKKRVKKYSTWERFDNGDGVVTAHETYHSSMKEAVNYFISVIVGWIVMIKVTLTEEQLWALIEMRSFRVEMDPTPGARYRTFDGWHEYKKLIAEWSCGLSAEGPLKPRVILKMKYAGKNDDDTPRYVPSFKVKRDTIGSEKVKVKSEEVRSTK